MKAIFLHAFHLRVFLFVFFLLLLLSLGSLILVFLDPNCIVVIRDCPQYGGRGRKTTFCMPKVVHPCRFLTSPIVPILQYIDAELIGIVYIRYYYV